MEKKLKKNKYMCIYTTESRCCTPELAKHGKRNENGHIFFMLLEMLKG